MLSDIQWGSGVNGSALLTALQETTYTYYDYFKDCATAADVAAVLSANNTSTALAESFAQLASENLTAKAGTSTATSSAYTITVTGAGYYLIQDDETKTLAEGDSYTDIILQVVDDVEVSAKADTTTVDKKVDSNTDSDNETTADYDIGDDVPFTLIANLPSNYASYSEYKLTFHDTLTSGLSFNNDVEVSVYTVYTGTAWAGDTYYEYDSTTGVFSKVDTTTVTDPVSGTTYYTKTTVTGGYSVATSTAGTLSDSTCTFEVQIADTNSLTDGSSTITVASTSKIVVEYTAKLLSTAATEETNKVKLEYSNNPNDDGTGTGTTTEDITTVFTFTLDVDKVDGDGNALSGAGFTLYKEVQLTAFETGVDYYTVVSGEMTAVDTSTVTTPASGETYYVSVETITTGDYKSVTGISSFDTSVTYYTYDGTNYTAVDTTNTPDSTATYYIKITSEFTFDGLGVGNYVLVESTTPTGYNTMADKYFTISAVTKEDADGKAYVESLTITGTDGSDFSSVADTQLISTDIQNVKGSTLPSTGGIGTTIFYVVGGVMVVGALTLLITRLRMRKRKSI
ncbi:MAG: isopeptide-forming domain-containing fimbrial protein [Oscillospiraceae bacterium]|nr:isopeptide-forming domain-containing fimbrial protein [Oscillospiraceae bacterium]